MKNFCNDARANLAGHFRFAATIILIAAMAAVSTACAPQGNDDELEAAQQQSDRRREESQERKPSSTDVDERADASSSNNKKQEVADATPAAPSSPTGTKKKVNPGLDTPAAARSHTEQAPTFSRSNWAKSVPASQPPAIAQPVALKPVTIPVTDPGYKGKDKNKKKDKDEDYEDVESELGHTPKINLPYNEELYTLGRQAVRDMSVVCGEKPLKTTKVTHYYVPILKNFNAQACHFVEGVCHFQKNGVTHVYNYDGNARKASPHKAVPLSLAKCKSGIGYGINENCTHPCRSLAASVTHHKPGEVIFFKNLVGMKCGIGKYAMIHDGFMVVNDTGAKKHFNHTGRFDFFFGPCRKKKNGICQEGGMDLSAALTKSPFCRVWKPNVPTINAELKDKIYTVVQNESVAKGDDMYAARLNRQQFISYRTQRGRTR